MKTMKVLVTFCFLLLISCGKSSSTTSSPISLPDEDNISQGTALDSVIEFCSKLNFSGMSVPTGLTSAAANSWALALNITGSFEGHQGWINLTNNFDGQGLSMGLLNQTLGTGSLQPLLIQMHQKNPNTLKNQFEASRYKSLISMLDQWSSLVIKPAAQEDFLIQPDDMPLNSLDIQDSEMFMIMAASENSQSVNWAVSNLYTDNSGRNFKPEWKKELQTLINTAGYRSIQMEASSKLHKKAMQYIDLFKMQNLNSYLFFFDIVVQNGGLYQKNIDDYNAFIARNPSATENQKLLAILESRLVQVKTQFREDVRSRKTALINGQGKVHGMSRNFRVEYCY